MDRIGTAWGAREGRFAPHAEYNSAPREGRRPILLPTPGGFESDSVWTWSRLGRQGRALCARRGVKLRAPWAAGPYFVWPQGGLRATVCGRGYGGALRARRGVKLRAPSGRRPIFRPAPLWVESDSVWTWLRLGRQGGALRAQRGVKLRAPSCRRPILRLALTWGERCSVWTWSRLGRQRGALRPTRSTTPRPVWPQAHTPADPRGG